MATPTQGPGTPVPRELQDDDRNQRDQRNIARDDETNDSTSTDLTTDDEAFEDDEDEDDDEEEDGTSETST